MPREAMPEGRAAAMSNADAAEPGGSTHLETDLETHLETDGGATPPSSQVSSTRASPRERMLSTAPISAATKPFGLKSPLTGGGKKTRKAVLPPAAFWSESSEQVMAAACADRAGGAGPDPLALLRAAKASRVACGRAPTDVVELAGEERVRGDSDAQALSPLRSSPHAENKAHSPRADGPGEVRPSGTPEAGPAPQCNLTRAGRAAAAAAAAPHLAAQVPRLLNRHATSMSSIEDVDLEESVLDLDDF